MDPYPVEKRKSDRPVQKMYSRLQQMAERGKSQEKSKCVRLTFWREHLEERNSRGSEMDLEDILCAGMAVLPWVISIGAVTVLVAFARWLWCLV